MKTVHFVSHPVGGRIHHQIIQCVIVILKSQVCLRLIRLPRQRTAKRRMAADGKIHHPVLPVFHFPHHLQGIPFQTVARFQPETERILAVCLRIVLNRQPKFIFCPGNQRKFLFSGKSVLLHGIRLPLIAVLLIPEISHHGKQQRRNSGPVFRISAPQILLPGLLLHQGTKLRAVCSHRCLQDFILYLKRPHTPSLPFIFSGRMPIKGSFRVSYFLAEWP